MTETKTGVPWNAVKVCFELDMDKVYSIPLDPPDGMHCRGEEMDHIGDEIAAAVSTHKLPRGWELDELDFVMSPLVIFRTEGIPTVEDGQKIMDFFKEKDWV